MASNERNAKRPTRVKGTQMKALRVEQAEKVLGGKGKKQKASFNDFNFTHHVDKASPVLLL